MRPFVSLSLARMQTVSWTLRALTPDIVFITDDDTGMSVTNAAELVVCQCLEQFGDRRIVYRDSMGRWDELMHRDGRFVGFRPFAMDETRHDADCAYRVSDGPAPCTCKAGVIQMLIGLPR